MAADSPSAGARSQPMHQSSIWISSESVRRMDPTGQPTMHLGSVHERHAMVTRYLPKRGPSRVKRATPSCASEHALTHSSQRVQRSRSISRVFCEL